MSVRVVIVDDHGFVSSGLALLLNGGDAVEVVATLDDPRDVPEALTAHRPDVLVTDMAMPRMSGDELIASLREHPHAPPAVVLSALTSCEAIAAAFRAGAVNYVFKDEPLAQIAKVLVDAANGTSTYSPEVTSALATQFVHEAPGPPVELSSREREILTLVSKGLTNRQVCRTLSISEATVKTYLSRCYTKLEVNDRASAVRVALEKNLLDD